MENLVGLNLSMSFPGDPNVAADHAWRFNSKYHVILDHTANRALSFAQHPLFAGTTIIDRHVEHNDGNWWRMLSPQDMVNKIASRVGRGVLVRYVLNEPGIANAAEDVVDPVRREIELKRIEEFVKWCVDVLDLAAVIGERVCIGNLWAGTPHEYWVSSGAFDPLIRALDRHHNLHILGLHEGSPFMFAGKEAITLAYEKLKDISIAQESQWGDPVTTETSNAWMTGRCWQWGKRAIEIGCKPPRIVLTEFTPAKNEHDGAKELYRYLTNLYGVPIGRYMDGIPTLLNTYAAYFGLNNIAYIIRRMLEWLGKFLPYNVEGVCIYCYNFQNDAGQSWREFNIGDLTVLLNELINHPIPAATRQYKTVPKKIVVLVPHTKVTALGLNVRKSDPAGSVSVGRVYKGTILGALNDYELSFVGKRGEWVRISSPVAGYVAADYVMFEEREI